MVHKGEPEELDSLPAVTHYGEHMQAGQAKSRLGGEQPPKTTPNGISGSWKEKGDLRKSLITRHTLEY